MYCLVKYAKPFALEYLHLLQEAHQKNQLTYQRYHFLQEPAASKIQEAHRIGLIHHVTTSSALPTAINDLTAQISQLAPQSLTAAKVSLAAINGHATNTDVQNAIRKCYESNDYQEGITAFIEKRSPDFNGT